MSRARTFADLATASEEGSLSKRNIIVNGDMAIAQRATSQAVTESGWGTSRFAKEYNALFGQYTYNEKKGVIPYEREIGKKHLIRHFSSLDKSVESYFKNINTHYAYEKFRSIRNAMHEDNLDIKLLTKALDVYAEDKSYVDTINSIIDSNEFTQFDLRSYIFTSS